MDHVVRGVVNHDGARTAVMIVGLQGGTRHANQSNAQEAQHSNVFQQTHGRVLSEVRDSFSSTPGSLSCRSWVVLEKFLRWVLLIEETRQTQKIAQEKRDRSSFSRWRFRVRGWRAASGNKRLFTRQVVSCAMDVLTLRRRYWYDSG